MLPSISLSVFELKFFPRYFPTRILSAFLVFLILATCPAHRRRRWRGERNPSPCRESNPGCPARRLDTILSHRGSLGIGCLRNTGTYRCWYPKSVLKDVCKVLFTMRLQVASEVHCDNIKGAYSYEPCITLVSELRD